MELPGTTYRLARTAHAFPTARGHVQIEEIEARVGIRHDGFDFDDLNISFQWFALIQGHMCNLEFVGLDVPIPFYCVMARNRLRCLADFLKKSLRQTDLWFRWISSHARPKLLSENIVTPLTTAANPSKLVQELKDGDYFVTLGPIFKCLVFFFVGFFVEFP